MFGKNRNSVKGANNSSGTRSTEAGSEMGSRESKETRRTNSTSKGSR